MRMSRPCGIQAPCPVLTLAPTASAPTQPPPPRHPASPPQVDWLTEKMRQNNFTVASMHGDMVQKERDAIMQEFRRVRGWGGGGGEGERWEESRKGGGGGVQVVQERGPNIQ